MVSLCKQLRYRLLILFFIASALAAPRPSLAASEYRFPRLASGPWSAGFAAIYEGLLKNLHEPNDEYPQRHAQPAPKFGGIYLWDSAFIADVWRHVDANVSQDILTTVLQNQQRDGRVPQIVNSFGTSGNTQPPLLGWAAARILKQNHDLAFARRTYPALLAYHNWLFANRRLPNGLFFWKNTYESGIDNSPRYSSRDESKRADTTVLAAVDLSAYAILDCEALSGIARALGKSEDAARLDAEATTLRGLINSLLWSESEGMYLDLDVRADERIYVRTIASFMPLAAGVPDAARAARLRAQLVDPRAFGTAIPFPSVAHDDPTFEKDCWRGPVWINMAYLTLEGLDRYQFAEDAAALARRLVTGVMGTWQTTGEFVEFYDPDRFDFSELSRKKGNWFKELTLGKKPVKDFLGWTALINNIVLERGLAPLESYF